MSASPLHDDPAGRRLALALVALGAYAGLAVAVAAGALGRVDQATVQHLMIWATRGHERRSSLLETALPLFHASVHQDHLVGSLAAFLVKWPASAVPSTVIVIAAAAVLVRRGRPRASVAWLGAWLVANLAEIVAKHTIDRPPLTFEAGGVPTVVAGLDGSFPSGHMLRCVLLAALVPLVLPRLRSWCLAWVAVVGVALVAGGYHTTSDVLGGLVLGLGTAALADAVARREAGAGSRAAAPRPRGRVGRRENGWAVKDSNLRPWD